MLGMILMVDGFHWNEFLGKLMVSAMSLVLNYIMSKLFIFKKKKDEDDIPEEEESIVEAPVDEIPAPEEEKQD